MATTFTIDLEIGGMTCASCAARVERALNNVDGVSASVNYALETARVRADADTPIDPAHLIEAVAGAGYEARLPAPAATAAPEAAADTDPVGELGRRVAIVAVLAAPVILIGMVPALQFTNWQWLSLMLTFPIATWGAW